MSSDPYEGWEARLHEIAAAFPYPPTPNLRHAGRQRLRLAHLLRRRTLVWAIALLVILSGSLAVPQVRASIRTFLRLGAVEVALPTATPVSAMPTTTIPQPTAISPTPLGSVLDLKGATTLDDAHRRVPFPIPALTYPMDLGPPDRVFVQDLGGPSVILVWLAPGDQTRARLSLQILSDDIFARKTQTTTVEQTTVRGQPALWVRGPHLFQIVDPQGRVNLSDRRLVDGNVLIWHQNTLTYRLETEQPLAEAIRSAESLR